MTNAINAQNATMSKLQEMVSNLTQQLIIMNGSLPLARDQDHAATEEEEDQETPPEELAKKAADLSKSQAKP